MYVMATNKGEQSERQPEDTGASSNDKTARPQIIDSAELLAGRREVWIEHGEDMYRLRLTSSGKLYLTK